MITRIEIAVRPDIQDPRGRETADAIRSFLGIPVREVRTREIYRIDTPMSDDERRRVLEELTDPVLHVGAMNRLKESEPFDAAITVGYKPGVTDPVGKSARVAVEDTLGREIGEQAAVFTSRRYVLYGVDRDQAERIGVELLANPVIQTLNVESWDEWQAAPADLDVPRVAEHPTPAVETVELPAGDDALQRISRERLLALSAREMRVIRDHFGAEERAAERRAVGLAAHPTDVELECLAQTWSEHCKHKIWARHSSSTSVG